MADIEQEELNIDEIEERILKMQLEEEEQHDEMGAYWENKSDDDFGISDDSWMIQPELDVSSAIDNINTRLDSIEKAITHLSDIIIDFIRNHQK